MLAVAGYKKVNKYGEGLDYRANNGTGIGMSIMYGSTEGQEKDEQEKDERSSTPGANEEFPLVKKDGKIFVDVYEQRDKFLRYPFGENFDADFWDKVGLFYTLSNI